jgi:ATP-dependent RNA helicase DeaD
MEFVPKRFDELGLSPDTLAGLKKAGFVNPSAIQAELIPRAIAGIDCIGQAQTGTGKTASFVLPILERIDLDSPKTQALVLAPTRELSQQVAAEAVRLSIKHNVSTACLVGGKPLKPQIAQLQKGAQIVIGTPGRVIDLLQRRALLLKDLRIVVLDEADRMLDIGFRPDIERILKQCPSERQTLLLSATLPAPVERLAQKYMRQPERIDITPTSVGHTGIEQFVITVDPERKLRVLVQVLIQEKPQQAIVFTRTKRGAEKVHRYFEGRLPKVAFIHGDLAQSARDRVMKQFREGKIRLLIATDVMGRGIDVSGISHIINYDVPQDCDDYVHRIGRTGRLSSTEGKGMAITLLCRDEGEQLTSIEKRINRMLEAYPLQRVQAARPTPPRPQLSKTDPYASLPPAPAAPSPTTVPPPGSPAVEEDEPWVVFD